MLSEEFFFKVFLTLCENFDFEASAEYQKILFLELKNKINDADFDKSAHEIMRETKKDAWNKAYGYRGKPAIADWVDAIVPKGTFKKKVEYKKCEITGATLVRQVLTEVKNDVKKIENNS